jgi:pyruvate dehydrogenase E1 component alpha subunit
MFETMLTIRTADEAFSSLIMSGQAMLMLYSPRGHEAIAAGVSVHLTADDYVVTTYRGLHDQIAKGVPLPVLFAEFLGRSTGTCKGKGGGMHITHPASGLMVTTGIVGGGIPIANGLALAAKLRGQNRVAVCNFGDGASNIGAFHEALNLAALWQLPVVFVCQNNGYAEHTPYAKGTSVDHIVERAAAYRMPGLSVDGTDPVAVAAAAEEAIGRARAGGGPTLLEASTYRLGGHFVGANTSYMPSEELERAQASDPLVSYRAWLISHGHASEEDLAGIEKRVKLAVEEATSFAMGSPFPDLDEIRRDVYAEEVSA